MTSKKDSANAPQRFDDALTELSGIGKAAERDLHSLGVRTFTELIQYTAAELATALYEHTGNARYSVSLIEREEWIGQAKTKVTEREAPAAVLMDAPETSDQKVRNRLEDWNLQAEFTLYFENRPSDHSTDGWQTRVWRTRICEKEYDDQKTFEGVAPTGPNSWVDWILDHAEFPGEMATFSPCAPQAVAETEPLLIDPTVELLTTELLLAESPDVLPGAKNDIRAVEVIEAPMIASGKQLTTTITFRISGKDAGKLTDRAVLYQTQTSIMNINGPDDEPVLAATGYGQLEPGVYEYTNRCLFAMPDVGNYEWACAVLISPPYPVKAIYRGPQVNVHPPGWRDSGHT